MNGSHVVLWVRTAAHMLVMALSLAIATTRALPELGWVLCCAAHALPLLFQQWIFWLERR